MYSIMWCSSLAQATGEAQYLDDIPSYGNELHAAFVYSKKAHAKIVSSLSAVSTSYLLLIIL